MIKRAKIAIHGVVQGVGFRPFVYRLAKELNVKGWIVNSTQGVFIDAEGYNGNIEKFLSRLKTDKPKNSFIQSFEHTFLDPAGFDEFEIKESNDSGSKTALVLPDIATCDDCLKEIFDPSNRRYLYPFTNCTNCGPRFSIIKSLPYDRKNTTMSEFEMCPECLAEYTNPLDRRFHAEPTACPNCGPHVELTDNKGSLIASKHEAVQKAAELIKSGKIIALKGIGGYQLLCNATNPEVIKLLRQRKHRSEKPFALMFPDLKSIKKECEVSNLEEKLITASETPIVLLKKRRGNGSVVSLEAAVDNPYLGIMLSCSPLHHILMHELNFPIIATSGNVSEEPICIDEETAFEKLGGIADYFLVHKRKILRHEDDSITRIAAGREMIIRRARGYAPLPILINGINQSVLAAGAHLKNTIAVNNNNNVFISQHVGDLENTESITAFKNVINDLESFYEIKPAEIVCDLHPDYISTKFAKGLNQNTQQVQHHYAHVLSCMAENNIDGNVLGVSWDGTGYGTDGTIWGSEFLISEGRNFKRAANLQPFKLPGGEKAIHEIWRIGFALLYDVYGSDAYKYFTHDEKALKLMEQMLEKNINSPVTTSMGRLFDGVASILNIRQEANYEAQGAMDLEFAADGLRIDDFFNFKVAKNNDNTFIINWHTIVKEIVHAL
ncbi:MAG TPA: carbamoyltransferase HypF, partial [Ignavibacteria bacterium]